MEEIVKILKRYFDPYVNTTIEEWKPITEQLQVVEVPNKSIIKYPDERENHLRFIIEGGAVLLMQNYGREICFDISFENDFLSDYESLILGKPSKIYIKNFEPLQYVAISRGSLLACYKKSPVAAQIGRVIAERQTFKLREKQFSNFGTAVERHDRMMSNYPQVMQRAPQGYLASYLDISPQSLSRIRRRRGE